MSNVGPIRQTTNVPNTSFRDTMHNEVPTLETYLNISDSEINDINKNKIKKSLVSSYESNNFEISDKTCTLILLLAELAYNISQTNDEFRINGLINSIDKLCENIDKLVNNTGKDKIFDTMNLLKFIKGNINSGISDIFFGTVRKISNTPHINGLGFKETPPFSGLGLSYNALVWVMDSCYKEYCDESSDDDNNELFCLSDFRIPHTEEQIPSDDDNITKKTQETTKPKQITFMENFRGLFNLK